MKRLRGPLVLLCILAFSALPGTVTRAEYDPSGMVKQGKRWAMEVGLRTGYDDNTTTATNNKKGSWFGGANVIARYSYPTDTTFVSASTSASGNFFADRPGDLFDFNNAFDVTLAHTFNPRLSLDAADHFRYGQEPQLADNNTIYRRQGDFINNGITGGLSYQLSTKWFLGLSVSHDLWHYNDAGLRADLERQSITVGPSLTYRLTEKTSLSLNYSYTDISYDQSPRDAESHNVNVGVTQSITRRWSASLSAGAEIRNEDNVGSKQSYATPFVNFGTTYLLGDKAKIGAGLRYSNQETDATTFYFSQSTSGYLSADWEFARHLTSSTAVNIVQNELTNAIATGTAPGDEWTYVFSEEISWQLRDYVSLVLRYTWTRVDSDLVDRAYRRNVVSVGANFTF